MYNDSETISASEVNRYVYCNYQWYYSRLYGSKKLNSLKKELNESLKVKTDSRAHAFVRGNKFHKNYDIKYKIKKSIKRIIIILVILLSLIALFLLYNKNIQVGDFL